MEQIIVGSVLNPNAVYGINKNFEYLFKGRQRIEELNDKAAETLQYAEQINQGNIDTNERLDNIIADSGTSSTEVTDARGDFTVLRGRFEHNEGKTPLYVVDYGVSHTKTAEENTPLFKQAINDAGEENRPIELPWVPNGQWVEINEPLTLNVSGLHIIGHGNQSRIRQNTFPSPIFDVIVPDVTIEPFYASSVDFNGSGYTETFRGHLHQSYHSAVAVYADRVTVKNIKVHNYVAGVLVFAWDVQADVKRERLKNVVVDGVEVSEVNFGLLAQDTENLYYDNIKGSYKLMPGIPTPPHLIYFVDGDHGNVNSNGGVCNAYDGEYSSAYQFKGMIGGSASKLLANNSMGTLKIMHSKDFRVDTVAHLGDNYDSDQYASVHLELENENVVVDSVYLDIVGDGQGVKIDPESTDCEVNKAVVKTTHTTESPTNTYDVSIDGTNNAVNDVKVENRGTHPRTASIGIWGGTGNRISRPETKGNQRGVVVRSGDGHEVVDYDLEKLKHENYNTGSKPLEVTVPTKLIPIAKQANGIGDQNRLLAFDRVDALGPFSSNTLHYTTSGHLWEESGIWRHENNRIYSDSGTQPIAYIDVETPNIDLSAGIKYSDKEYLGLRMISEKDLIMVRLNHETNTLQVYGKINSSSSLLAEEPFTVKIGRRYHIRAQIFDNTIDVQVDNEKVISSVEIPQADMDNVGNVTTHGVGTSTNPSGLFDNLEWRKMD